MATIPPPIISKPGITAQRPPIQVVQKIPLWIPLMMVFVTTLSVVALAFSILRTPEAAGGPKVSSSELNITGSDAAPPEEGKEVLVKIIELERNLAAAKTEIRRLNEELISVRSNMDGLNANVTIVQNQTAKLVPPVNIQPPQPEIKN